MKYIRTKDGRIIDLSKYENIKEDETCYYIINKDYKPNSKNISKMFRYKIKIDKKDIIAKADTIEELCDCFIAVDKNGNLCGNPMIAKGHCFKSFCNYYKANGIDVDCYLAILTDKGLIFVAKMNEKGELELL